MVSKLFPIGCKEDEENVCLPMDRNKDGISFQKHMYSLEHKWGGACKGSGKAKCSSYKIPPQLCYEP